MAKRKNNGVGSICQGKDGYWRAKIQIGTNPETGKPMFKNFSGTSKAAVQKKLKEYKEDIGQHKSEAIKKVTKTKTTEFVDDAFTQWLLNIKKPVLKPESYSRLISTVNYQIIDRIGELNVSELNTNIIQEKIINAMFEEGLSLSSIKKTKSALNDFYNYWRKTEYAKTGILLPNIIDLIVLPAGHKFEAKEIVHMPDTDVQLFLNTLYRKDSLEQYVYEYRDLICLILNTGLRLGEGCGLEISDYNPDEKSLFIKRNLIETPETYVDDKTGFIAKGKRRLEIQNSLKTASGYRKLPLNNCAIGCIERLIKRAERISPKAKYLAVTTSGELIWPSNLVKTINRIFDNATLNYSGAHVLRHTYATALFSQGIDIKVVSSLLGHSNIQITGNTYVHFLESIKYSNTKESAFRPYPEFLLKKGTI